jgi:hypothetical protein
MKDLQGLTTLNRLPCKSSSKQQLESQMIYGSMKTIQSNLNPGNTMSTKYQNMIASSSHHKSMSLGYKSDNTLGIKEITQS